MVRTHLCIYLYISVLIVLDFCLVCHPICCHAFIRQWITVHDSLYCSSMDSLVYGMAGSILTASVRIATYIGI